MKAGPPRTLPRLEALEQWEAEICAGTRKNDMGNFDNLDGAASCQAAARIAVMGRSATDGDWQYAERMLDRARLRLHGYWGDSESKEAREILGHLKTAAPERSSLPAAWSAVPDARGWAATPGPRGWR